MKKRIAQIDIVKGIGILLVVLGHAIDGTVTKLSLKSGCLTELHDWIYLFHMPLFFTLNGYLTAYSLDNRRLHSGQDNRRYILRHGLNYGLLYLIWSLIYCISKIALSDYITISVTWRDVALLPVKTVGPYWFLYVLLILYLIFVLLDRLDCPISLFFAVTVPLSICGYCVRGSLPMELNRVMIFAVYYAFGVLGCRYILHNNLSGADTLFSSVIRVTTIPVCIAATVVLLKNGQMSMPLAALSLINAISYIVLFCWLSGLIAGCGNKAVHAAASALGKLGEHSLAVYLMHVFFLTGAVNAAGFLPAPVIVLIAFTAGVLCPLIAEILLRKMHLEDHLLHPVTLLIR